MQELKQAKGGKRTKAGLKPSEDALDRFSRSLAPIASDDRSIGLAVSGGPDSLALLLLAAAARPGKVEAATVDHNLRKGSRDEADMVAALCKELGGPHKVLTIAWEKPPGTAIQELCRARRYQMLNDWATAWGMDVLLTAHHAEDQAETLLMRLVRGSGVRGLAGMRAVRKQAGSDVLLGRPLLGWTRKELAEICAAAGVEPAVDPSNSDPRFERVRMRQMLAKIGWLDPIGIANSATFLNQADDALRWAANHEWRKRVQEEDEIVTFDPVGLPREISRRIVRAIIMKLETEGKGADLRGAEIERVMDALAAGKKTTLRGVLCGGGAVWRFATAPQRRPVANKRAG
jgi:tRNA(Ile)-lysidine synthase